MKFNTMTTTFASLFLLGCEAGKEDFPTLDSLHAFCELETTLHMTCSDAIDALKETVLDLQHNP